MPTNFYMFFLTALIPMIVGAVYYHPKVVGNAWMKTNGFTTEFIQKGNMPLIMGLSYVFAVMLSFFVSTLVIHQGAIMSVLYPEAMESGSAAQAYVNDFMANYEDRHRGFSHGAVHGIMITVFFILPIISINALFERRGWKYILIHAGYWLISIMLIGGILCQTLNYAPLS